MLAGSGMSCSLFCKLKSGVISPSEASDLAECSPRSESSSLLTAVEESSEVDSSYEKSVCVMMELEIRQVLSKRKGQCDMRTW